MTLNEAETGVKTASCSVRHSCPTHPPNFKWNHPGQTLLQTQTLENGQYRMNVTLTFHLMRSDHKKTLQCSVQYHGGRHQQVSKVLQVKCKCLRLHSLQNTHVYTIHIYQVKCVQHWHRKWKNLIDPWLPLIFHLCPRQASSVGEGQSVRDTHMLPWYFQPPTFKLPYALPYLGCQTLTLNGPKLKTWSKSRADIEFYRKIFHQMHIC